MGAALDRHRARRAETRPLHPAASAECLDPETRLTVAQYLLQVTD
jgi:hypothetical protein